MSDTEAMDISSSGSVAEDTENIKDKVGSKTGEPSQNAETGHTAPSVVPPSDIHMEGADPLPNSGIRMREDAPGDSDPNDRPLKRARTLETQPILGGQSIIYTEPSTESMIEGEGEVPRSDGLTTAQQDYCERVLNSICKLSAANPFLEPVDPVQAKAPDYYQVITQPMDLSTIDGKIKSRVGGKSNASSYMTLQEFVDDVNLVFDNCFKYNGSTHAISQLAVRVKDAFEEGMKTAPGAEGLRFIPVPGASSSQDAAFSPGVRQMSQSMSDLAIKSSSPSALKRRNTAVPAKPVPSGNLNARSRRDPLRIAQEKFCKVALDHLYRAEYEQWALPFLGPVDLNAYPDYLETVKQPMDFGTISDKLSHGVYATAEEFRSDVKLVFSNCYAFNPTWASVYDSAQKLEAAFDEKWKGLPLSVPESAPQPKGKRTSNSSTAPARSKAQSTTPKRTPRPKVSQSIPITITEEELFSLCEILCTLSDQEMDRIIALIRKRMPRYRDNTEELALEIEKVPESVQAEMLYLLKRSKEKKDSGRRDRAGSESSSLSSAATPYTGSSDESDRW